MPRALEIYFAVAQTAFEEYQASTGAKG